MLKRVYLEITDACNLNCPFCENEKGSSFMSLSDIKKYLAEIKEECSYLYLHVLGEPLLHKNFEEILSYCDELNFNIQLVTNGILLDKYPNILKHKSLRKLSISLHSINGIKVKENYFDNINKLIESNSDKKIELRFYDSINLDEKLKGYLNTLYTKYDVKETDRFNSYKLKENVYIKYSELFKWPNIKDEIISKRGNCKGAKSQIAILHNGDVTLCCLDPKGFNSLGNLNKSSLKEILKSNEYLSVCKGFDDNKLLKELCQKCSYRTRFR